MKLRIGLLIVLCLLCLLNFKVQWDRYGQGQASIRRATSVTIWTQTRDASGDCIMFTWRGGNALEPGDSWKVCPKD